jgi:hypothetical protein
MYLFASGGPQPDYLPANGWPNGHVSQVGFCKTNGNDFSRFRWCKTYGHATARPVPVTFAIHPLFFRCSSAVPEVEEDRVLW